MHTASAANQQPLTSRLGKEVLDFTSQRYMILQRTPTPAAKGIRGDTGEREGINANAGGADDNGRRR